MSSFLKQLRKENLSSNSLRAYRNDLQVFLGWYESSPEALTAVDVMNYWRHLTREGAQQATINRKLQTLRRFCRWTERGGKLQFNPAVELKLARPLRDLRAVELTEPEVNALLRAAGQSRHGLAKRNYALLQILLQAGLLVSEVAALRIADAVLRERTGSLKVRRGEGGEPREVPLNTAVRRALKAYLETRKPFRPEDPLITSETGAAISIRAIQSVVAELARRAKITRIRVTSQSMRHT
ncbi:MAG TPA: tyrosine-type recombinase/integrase, partial [Terriglobales bacterium]|nr:tyrosine-type recombinase/integrase [Terriglobales bacterium]